MPRERFRTGSVAATLRSGQQDRAAGGLSRLEIAMGPGRILQPVFLADTDFDRPGDDHLEQVAGMGQQVLPAGRCSASGSAG